MAKQFSVFVNIGGKVDKSLPAAAAAAQGIISRLSARFAVLNTATAGAFAKGARNLAAAGKSLGEAGRSLTARASAPLGALGLSAGKMAFEFEKAGNMLEALGDASAQQRKEFEALANTLNKKYPQSLTGIINTGNELLKGGFNFEQMKGAIDQTLATAVLGEMAPAEVGNMMARTINSFQLPMATYQEAMRSSQRVSDQMTFAAVKTTASLKDMGEMYRYVGGASSAAGIGLEQATAFAMAFAKNGSVGSDERVVMATRSDGERWFHDHYQGGDYVAPTHFLDVGVPEGLPLTPDPDVLRAREETARIERERQTKAEAERAVLREARTEAEREAFWADPDKRLAALTRTGDP